MKWEVRVRPHSSYPWPGRALDKWKCGSSESWNSSPQMIRLYRSWAFTHYASTHVVWARWVTHWVAGDGLHISFICQLPYQRTFPAWHKNKQTQALPLKEGFRQVPAQVTGQVFQTTWSQESYTYVVKQPSKSKFKLNLSNLCTCWNITQVS